MRNYPIIDLPGLSNIEAELGEVVVSPQGITYAVPGRKHYDGGTDMLVEPGSVILSDYIKLPELVSTTLGGPDRRVTPADLSRKYPTDKYEKILSDTTGKWDSLSRKTADLMLNVNSGMQAAIFSAQESYKESKGMSTGLKQAQAGGAVGAANALPKIDFTNVRQIPGAGTMSRSVREGLIKTVWEPFAGDPYFAVQDKLLSGKKLSAADKVVLGDRQKRLSNIRNEFGDTYGLMIEKEYAKYLQQADAIESDKYLDKFVTKADGTEIPLSQASEDDIDNAKSFRYFNKRTGKNDLVDYRDRQNQGFNPKFTFEKIDYRPAPAIAGISPLTGIDINRQPPASMLTPVVPPAPTPGKVPDPGASKVDKRRGLDTQSIINGVQMGLAAIDLANTTVKAPYYDYRPQELAYTRFEPINTKQQERAYNIAQENVRNSNLPEQIKMATLANIAAGMQEGINQIDLANQQGKLNNDNANVALYRQVRNQDIGREQEANLRYQAEADRRNYLRDAQRQIYLDSIMGIWRDHAANRRDIRLVDQMSPRYNYNFNTENVEYVPGSGMQAMPNQLDAFRPSYNLPGGIQPSDLTAEARRRLGL